METYSFIRDFIFGKHPATYNKHTRTLHINSLQVDGLGALSPDGTHIVVCNAQSDLHKYIIRVVRNTGDTAWKSEATKLSTVSILDVSDNGRALLAGEAANAPACVILDHKGQIQLQVEFTSQIRSAGFDQTGDYVWIRSQGDSRHKDRSFFVYELDPPRQLFAVRAKMGRGKGVMYLGTELLRMLRISNVIAMVWDSDDLVEMWMDGRPLHSGAIETHLDHAQFRRYAPANDTDFGPFPMDVLLGAQRELTKTRISDMLKVDQEALLLDLELALDQTTGESVRAALAEVLAECLEDRGEHKLALRHLKAALKRTGIKLLRARIQQVIGESYLRHQNKKSALTYFRQALKNDPNVGVADQAELLEKGTGFSSGA